MEWYSGEEVSGLFSPFFVVLFCFFRLFLLLKVFLENVFCGHISLGNAVLIKSVIFLCCRAFQCQKRAIVETYLAMDYVEQIPSAFYNVADCKKWLQILPITVFALFAQQLRSSYNKRDEVKVSILWICTWPCNLLWLIEY